MPMPDVNVFESGHCDAVNYRNALGNLFETAVTSM